MELRQMAGLTAVTAGGFGMSLGLVLWFSAQPGVDLADPLVWLAEICFGTPMTEEEMARMAEDGTPLRWVVLFGFVALAGLGFAGRRQASVPLAASVDRVNLDQDAAIIICKIARATGGVCAPELLAPLKRLCMSPPTLPAIAATLARAGTVPAEEAIAPFNRALDPVQAERLIATALQVGWSNGRFTPEALTLIGGLTNVVGITEERLVALFEEIHPA